MWTDPDLAGLLMMQADFTTHEFAPHVHEELVIAITEDGGSEFNSRGVRETAEPESVLVFNPGEPHSGRMAGSRRWRYRAFYLGDAVLRRLGRDLEVAPASLPHFLVNKLRDQALGRRFLGLHRAAEGEAPLLQRETELLAVMARLFVTHGNPAPPLPRLGDERSLVATIRDYLADNYRRSIGLKDLAQLAGMSTFHIIRSFNKDVGMSPHAYLTLLRVRNARDLLSRGIAPADAALDVGLYDQSALSRHFKRVYGVTPGQYVSAMGLSPAALDSPEA